MTKTRTKVTRIFKRTPAEGEEPYGHSLEQRESTLKEMEQERRVESEKRASRSVRRTDDTKSRASSAPTKKTTSDSKSTRAQKKQRKSVGTEPSSSKENADLTNNDTSDVMEKDAVVTFNDDTEHIQKSRSEDNNDPEVNQDVEKDIPYFTQKKGYHNSDDEGKSDDDDSVDKNARRSRSFNSSTDRRDEDDGDDYGESASSDSSNDSTSDSDSSLSGRYTSGDSFDENFSEKKPAHRDSHPRLPIQMWKWSSSSLPFGVVPDDLAHDLWENPRSEVNPYRNYTPDRIRELKELCRGFERARRETDVEPTVEAIRRYYAPLEKTGRFLVEGQ